MIRTLSGENSFGLQHELRAIVDAFVAEQGDLALERIDGQEASYEQMREAVTSLPFLADKKLVMLRAPSANKQFVEHSAELLSAVSETTDLIIVEPKLDKRLAYYKLLKKQTEFTDFAPVDAHGLSRWLVEQAKLRGGSLSQSDAHYLVERVGANQQVVSNELDKLLLYDTAVSRKTIDVLTEAAPQSTIFELLEAAFAGNDRAALDLYAEQRALKVEPQQIIAMLAWQLHILALIKAAGDRSADVVAKDAKLNPYVVRKSQGIARKITIAELKTLVADLLRIDARSKRTALDLDEALQHFILKLAR